MLPLVSVPGFVHEYALNFKDIFSPALLESFERYLSGLFVSERRNTQRINDSFVVHVKDQSGLNRFLTEYNWSTEKVNERRLNLLFENKQSAPRRSGVLIIDDTFNEKFGKHFDSIGRFYLPSEQHYAMAHNVVTLHYADAVCDYPLEFRLYEQLDIEKAIALLKEHGVKFKAEVLARKKKDSDKRSYLGPKLRSVPKLRGEFPSKLDLACELADWAKSKGFRHPFVFDTWYTSKLLCHHISKNGGIYVGTVDKSEGIYFRGRWQSVGEWVSSRSDKEFEEVSFKYKEGVEKYVAGSWVAEVGKLGRIRLVASHHDKERADEGKYFVTNHLTWEKKQILSVRRRRWTIETSYEDVKGALGFDEYEVREIEAIKRHWYLVFAAYSASRAATAQSQFGKWVNGPMKSIGDVCRQVKGEALSALILFSLSQVSSGSNVDELLKQVLSHLAK